jgi:hypothetical protein
MVAQKLAFRIREVYLDQIERETKREEYRRDIPFWQLRIANLIPNWPKSLFFDPDRHFSISLLEPIPAVFICGKRKHTRECTRIDRIATPPDFSDQGKSDVDTDTCFVFHLGKEIISSFSVNPA